MDTTRKIKPSELEQKSFLGKAINHISRHKMAYGAVVGVLVGAAFGYYITPENAEVINYVQNVAGISLLGGVVVPAAIAVGEQFSDTLFPEKINPPCHEVEAFFDFLEPCE